MNQPVTDDSLIMISALQHFLFCRRQCALIHLEGAWEENRLTASGKILHERVDERKSEMRRDFRQATAVRLVSHRLGISGIADMLEFYRTESEFSENGQKTAISLPGLADFWRPFPVEYKRGRPKSHRADEVQLCAQAICLEEMLEVTIPSGALFYGEPRRWTDVVFNEELRHLTEETACGVHMLIDSGITPKPIFGKWCASCSLVEECRPKIIASHRSVHIWLEKEIENATQK